MNNAAPKHNAPNSPAWTRPLGSTPPPRPQPRPGSRAARVALWTAPLPQVTVQAVRS